TFYEGAMTAAGTFPTDATDQLIQANVVAARYDVAHLRINPVTDPGSEDPGLRTFSPGSSQDIGVTFTDTTGAAVTGVELSIAVPALWTSVVRGEPTTAPRL